MANVNFVPENVQREVLWVQWILFWKMKKPSLLLSFECLSSHKFRKNMINIFCKTFVLFFLIFGPNISFLKTWSRSGFLLPMKNRFWHETLYFLNTAKARKSWSVVIAVFTSMAIQTHPIITSLKKLTRMWEVH